MKNKGVRAYLSGVALGGVNGLFGGGGGMIAVPLLENALGYGEKQAHATAIFVIAPLCAVSAVNYALHGFIDLSVAIPVAIGNVVGGLLGAKFLNKLNAAFVRFAFIALMLVAGIRMIAF